MRVKVYLLFFFLITHLTASAQVSITFPAPRVVFQRNQSGNANVYVSGTYNSSQTARVEARLKTRPGEPGSAVGWTTIVNNPSGNVFSGFLVASGGRFDLEVRAVNASGDPLGSSVNIEKIGVGEVFLIVGHSNAAAANSAMTGATSDLVNTINNNADGDQYNKYLTTGKAEDLPPLQPVNLCQNCGIAPMATYPWFWSKLGDLLVNTLNVPVLFYSAAFGGSNMGHLYKAAYNIKFEHGFINYNIRMPYVNIRNAMSKYVPRTGLRAILSAHGINDGDTTAAGFYYRSQKVMEKTREEANYQDLAWLVATSCYNNGIRQDFTDEQNHLINSIPNTFRGANLNAIDNSGRYDGLHFNELGQQQAAQLWLEAITNPTVNVLGNAKSLMAQAPPLPPPPLPVTLVSFNGKQGINGFNELEWATSSETSNDYFEIQKSKDAVRFEVAGTVKGVGDTKEFNRYHFTDESPAANVTYYRLNQVDYDGTATLSRIIAIKNEQQAEDQFVYPNPSEHMIEISTDNGSEVTGLRVLDLTGKVLIEKPKGKDLNVSALKPGEYILEFKVDSGEFVRKKITKL